MMRVKFVRQIFVMKIRWVVDVRWIFHNGTQAFQCCKMLLYFKFCELSFYKLKCGVIIERTQNCERQKLFLCFPDQKTTSSSAALNVHEVSCPRVWFHYSHVAQKWKISKSRFVIDNGNALRVAVKLESNSNSIRKMRAVMLFCIDWLAETVSAGIEDGRGCYGRLLYKCQVNDQARYRHSLLIKCDISLLLYFSKL